MSDWTMDRHSNTERYVAKLTASDDPERTFVAIVRALMDPRVSCQGDVRGPIADLVDALDLTRGVTR